MLTTNPAFLACCHLHLLFVTSQNLFVWAVCVAGFLLGRYPVISGRHVPTDWGLAVQRNITYGKVWLAAKLLELTGRSRYATRLMTSFKAFCVQNTPGYARSIISCVDNAIELRESIVQEERADWPCVWEQGRSADWVDYVCLALTGANHHLQGVAF